ncbi:MAG TPA: orotidine 5'-phosphate decarboxylase / HUMPS family protein, partial [Acidimicrobiales bacterium]|nr:orotidine 5'-phosphate decarboxylase / HUMPS family protein [Acidimicrobiales bacterium]
GGIICAAPDLETTEPWADRLVRVVPGIRLPGGDTHDQARVAAPGDALIAGADLLVIGRMVTAADDPVAAAEELVTSLLS